MDRIVRSAPFPLVQLPKKFKDFLMIEDDEDEEVSISSTSEEV